MDFDFSGSNNKNGFVIIEHGSSAGLGLESTILTAEKGTPTCYECQQCILVSGGNLESHVVSLAGLGTPPRYTGLIDIDRGCTLHTPKPM